MRTRGERIDELSAKLREWFVSGHDLLFDELSEKATACALRVSPTTLGRWHWEGSGPKGFRAARVLNGRRWYRVRDVAALLVDGEVEAL